MSVVGTDRLYHYFLQGTAPLEAIVERGLLPLSSMPDHPAWHRMQESRFYEALYALLAEPVLRRPYTNSGVFLTPIDFRQLPDSPLATASRIAVPLWAVASDCSVLTYELDEQRIVLHATREALEEAAAIWTGDMVRAWFGRDKTKMFFYVPQVAVYQDGGIPIEPSWIE